MSYYFDYNATHPPFKEILLNCTEKYLKDFYNPSGPTRYSLSKQGVIETSRAYFSKITKKSKDQIVFSSTGTEANFLLVSGLVSYLKKFKKVFISPFEHSSFYGALEFFKIPYTLLLTDKTGLIDLNYLEEELKKEPAPLFLIHTSNETGVFQPIQESKQILSKYELPIFSDLMQAFGKVEIDYSLFDGFTFSGHKIGAGMGAALTYLDKKFINSEFQIFKGGNQENGHRAGTENTIAIQAFQLSAELQIANLEEKNKRLLNYRNKIESFLKNLDIEIIAENSDRLPSTSFILLPIDDIDFFMISLEEKGIIISNGSSCKSRSREASFSLLKMGYSTDEALRAIRISTGYFTNEYEVEKLLEEIKNTLNKLV
jgi:cysteine desulfurase